MYGNIHSLDSIGADSNMFSLGSDQLNDTGKYGHYPSKVRQVKIQITDDIFLGGRYTGPIDEEQYC